jgi:hypothetical protein
LKNRVTNHTKIKGIIFVLASIYITGCSQPGEKRSEDGTSSTKTKQDSVTRYKKPGSSFSDTLTINSASVVFFDADTFQVDQIKKIMPAMNFESNRHDCFYQMRNARMVIAKYWPQLKVIKSNGYRYLLFIKEDKSKSLVDLDGNPEMCGLYLFNRKKDPQMVDMMNIDTELGFYFKEK